jgi:hypothetical protein
VKIRAWRHSIIGVSGCQVPVYFLNADLPENPEWERALTNNLYGGDEGYRLCKETSGVDLWLNTPHPPFEASGTSGMKAAMNGVPSLSVRDGWWIEGHFEGTTGWSIGFEEDPERHDIEIASLYDKLERVILPMYYSHPEEYAQVMRSTIALNSSFFNTQRMLAQFVSNAYYPRTEVSPGSALRDDAIGDWHCGQNLIASARIRPPRRIGRHPVLPEGPHAATSLQRPANPHTRACISPSSLRTARGAVHNEHWDACHPLDALCEIERSGLLGSQTVSRNPDLRIPKTCIPFRSRSRVTRVAFRLP